MDLTFLSTNLTNPTLLFFVLGIVARLLKSDLEIPPSSSKFISLYLLFSIGFNGGQELTHTGITSEVTLSLGFGILLALVVPVLVFTVLKHFLDRDNAGALAAAYGSVSAVTFVAAASFLESRGLKMGGHMVAVMALMEAPAIVVGVALMRMKRDGTTEGENFGKVIKHSLTNGSVVMIVGSLVIGILSDSHQAQGIRPFTTDIFKGFLAIFLLDLGMLVAGRIKNCLNYGPVVVMFGVLGPLVIGCLAALLSSTVTSDVANRFTFAILAASASYIAVPAAMRLAAPRADAGLYIPMALGLTFPFNLTIGMPLYMAVVTHT